MPRDHLSDHRITIDTGIVQMDTPNLVERKGYGHPDTLADHLAEKLSRAYSRYTMENLGVVLHHNFDKLALLGGSSEVRYGGGRMRQPVRAQINGRAAHMCGNEAIPVGDLIETTVRAFFSNRLPILRDHLTITNNVTANSSPGAIHIGNRTPDRHRWFAPRSASDLRERRRRLSNDTSLGTGWAPLSSFESFVKDLADHFSQPSRFAAARPWCGTDVKAMGFCDGVHAEFVLCVPQISAHVPNRASYLENRDEIMAECHRLAVEQLPDLKAKFTVNARDLPGSDELYLTHTGSSIESGDEGVVGRGNRVNGLITPLRPMNLEGANGKNPVYHVGKLYNLAAARLARQLCRVTGGYAEVHLVSATGRPLDRPWRIVVRLAAADVDHDAVKALIGDAMDQFPAMTRELVDIGVLLS